MLGNFLESFIHNVIRDTVRPVKGSIVYCDLGFGFAEHSGVYVGDKQIVHLDGSGRIEVVDPKKFMDRLNGFNSAMSIYIACNGILPVGSAGIARTAKKMIGESRNYNVFLDNCHQFTSGCITGDFGSADNFLWMLHQTAKTELGANTWRAWTTVDGEYVE